MVEAIKEGYLKMENNDTELSEKVTTIDENMIWAKIQKGGSQMSDFQLYVQYQQELDLEDKQLLEEWEQQMRAELFLDE